MNNTCVIIANGPSLNSVPSEFFSLYPTWGVNKIFMPRPGTDFVIPISYYVTTHANMAPFAEEIKALNARMFITDKIAGLFPGATPIHSVNKKGFAADPTAGLWEGWSVIYVCLQLAYWLEFRTVLLVGLDHDYSNGSFHPDYNKGVDTTLGDRADHDQDRLLPAFRLAKQHYESHGRRIINLTPGTKEPIFEKGRLEEWTGK